MGKAKQLCPDLITMPYDFESYKKVSEKLYQTLTRLAVFIFCLLGLSTLRISLQFMNMTMSWNISH